MNTLRTRIGGVCLGLATVLVVGTLPLLSPDPAQGQAAAKGRNPARRTPPYFSKVGLSTDQREKIYSIREKYVGKVTALKKQIEDLQTQELAECETVLTEGQRKILNEQRSTAKGKGKAAAPVAENPAAEAGKATKETSKPGTGKGSN
jgi:hypothetical protein